MKKSNDDLGIKIRNLTYIVLIGFIILFILVIGLYFKGSSNRSTTTNSTSNSSGTTISNESYDVSSFNAVDVDGALALFDDGKTHVLYIGRSDCSYCQKTVPILAEVQEELGYTTDYLAVETNTINKSWSEWQTELAELAEKFSLTTEVNDEEDTYGNLLISKGYTPTVIIIQDGKMVDGFFGYKDASSIKTIVKKYL